MNKIAKFEKVSFEEFEKEVRKIYDNTCSKKEIFDFYDKIELPTRATSGSAGYDFKCPFPYVHICKNLPVVIPTGIRVKIEDGWVLKIYPRSGLGFNNGLELVNTVGIIDSDYYHSDNEGHIILKINHTEGEYEMRLQQNQGFVQGIFEPYGLTIDDNVKNTRNGGFGSTDK